MAGNVKVFSCPNCAKVYTDDTVDSFKAHVEKCGSVNFDCEECGKTFLSLQALKSHFKLFHIDCPSLPCRYCGKKFKRQFSLREHEKTHLNSTDRKLYACEYCDKSFLWKGSLRRHRQDHISSNIANAYICLCGETFHKYTALYSHKRRCVHAIEKGKSECNKPNVPVPKPGAQEDSDASQANHRCQYCGEGFTDRHTLSEHVDTCDPFMQDTNAGSQNVCTNMVKDKKIPKDKATPKAVKVRLGVKRKVRNIVNDAEQSHTEDADADAKSNNPEDSKELTIKTAEQKCQSTNPGIINGSRDSETSQTISGTNSNDTEETTNENDENKHGRSRRKRKMKTFDEYETDFSSPKLKKCLEDTIDVKIEVVGDENSTSSRDTGGGVLCSPKPGRKKLPISKLQASNPEPPTVKVWLSDRWVFDQNFRQEQERLKIPYDPVQWSVSHVKHWIQWAVRVFALEGVDIDSFGLTGQQLCGLTHADFVKYIPNDTGDIFWTHLELLRKVKFVAVKQTVTASTVSASGLPADQCSKCHSDGKKPGACQCGPIINSMVVVESQHTGEGTVKQEPTADKTEMTPESNLQAAINSLETKNWEQSSAGVKTQSWKYPSRKRNKGCNAFQRRFRKTDNIIKQEEPDEEMSSDSRLMPITYECVTDECNEHFFDRTALKAHKSKEHNEKLELLCIECMKTFTETTIYTSHLRMQHLDLNFVNLAFRNVELKYSNIDKKFPLILCVKCGTVLPSDTETHTCNKLIQMMFFCPYCKCSEMTYNNIQLHLKESHPEQVHTKKIDDKYETRTTSIAECFLTVDDTSTECPSCNCEFESNNKLMAHISKDHASGLFICGVCRLSYGRKAMFNRHVIYEHSSTYACDLCSKTFSHPQKLKSHKYVHSGERPFSCDICGKSYIYKKNVKTHMQTCHPAAFREKYKNNKPTGQVKPDSVNSDSNREAKLDTEPDCTSIPDDLCDKCHCDRKKPGACQCAPITDRVVKAESEHTGEGTVKQEPSADKAEIMPESNEQAATDCLETEEMEQDSSGVKKQRRKRPSRRKKKSGSAFYREIKFCEPDNIVTQDEPEEEMSTDLRLMPITYVCVTDECNKQFPNRKTLKAHKSKEHDEKLEFLCADCMKTFSQMSTYASHLRMQHLDLNFVNLVFRNVELKHSSIDKKFPVMLCINCSTVLPSDAETHTCNKLIQMKFFCPYCKCSEMTYNNIQQHLKESHPEQVHTKNIDAKYVTLRATSIDECFLTVDNTSTECPSCNCEFESNNRLMAHISTDHASKPFICGVCRLSYGRKSALNQHVIHHHKFKSAYTCDLCHKTFSEFQALKSHQYLHSGERPFSCDICGNRYSMKSSVRAHMRTSHQEAFREKYKNYRPTGQLKSVNFDSDGCVCPKCGQLFDTPKRLNRHMQVHKKDGGFQCSECLQYFESSFKLRLHKLKPRLCKKAIEMPKTAPQSQINNVHTMGDAEMKKTVMDLKIIDESHPSGKPYQCGACHKRFRKCKGLTFHIQSIHVENGAKSCMCSICGRGFSRRSTLEVHYRSHTSARPYRCRFCQKSYRQLGHVKEHLKSHGKGQYLCRFCQKSFRARGTFCVHIMTHCNIFPIKCPVESCEEQFRDVSDLCRHGASCFTENESATTRIFICKFCNETFEQSSEVISHLQVHENDGLFPCEVCNDQLSSFRNLYLHKEKNGHFLESELKEQADNAKTKLCNPIGYRRTVAPVDWDYDEEELMNQFDVIKESSLEPSESDEAGVTHESGPFSHTALTTHTTGVVEETCGNEAEELILIAEQLTNIGTVAEQYTDVVITDPTIHQMNNFEASYEDGQHIDHPRMMLQNCALNSKSISESLEYPSVVMKGTETLESTGYDRADLLSRNMEAEHLQQDLERSIADMPQTCKEVLKEIIYSTAESADDQIMKTKDLVAKKSKRIVTDSIYKDGNKKLDDRLKPQNIDLFHTDSSSETNITVVQDCGKKEQETRDSRNASQTMQVNTSANDALKECEIKNELFNNINVDISKDETADISQILNSLNFNGLAEDLDFSCPVKVVDTEGNEVTVCVVNERGEQEQVIDSKEILRTVLQTGRFKIQGKFKQIETIDNTLIREHSPLVMDLRKNVPKVGNSEKIKVTNVIVVSEKTDCEDTADVGSNKNKQSVLRKVKKDRKVTQINVENINKINGELVRYEEDSHAPYESDKVGYSVRLQYYQERGEMTFPFVCQTCGARFRRLKDLNSHKKTHLPDDQRKFKCTLCEKGFNVPSCLKVHMRTHSGDKPFSCSTCDKTFRQLGHLQVHMRIHKKYYPFKCCSCEKRFVTNSALNKHVRKHHNPGQVKLNLQCTLCKAQFECARDLKVHHLRIHVDKKSKKEFLKMCNAVDEEKDETDMDEQRAPETSGTMSICDVCGFQSKSNFSAKLHRHRHETGSDFPCMECDKAFATELLLNEHKRYKHADETPCEVCGRQFRTRSALAQHLLKVHRIGAFKFQCKRCSKRYRLQADFLRHCSVCLKNDVEKMLSDI